MNEILAIPAWAVALVLAGFAPFAARAWGKLVERRVRERTRQLLARGGVATRA